MTAQAEYETRNVDVKIPLRTEDELKAFIWLAFGVRLPDVQVCHNHSTPWRAFAEAYFAEHPVTVWKASRGFGGKSYTLALLSLVEALTLKADVNILGGSGKQSENVLEHMGKFWNSRTAPRKLLRSDPGRQETKIIYGNSVRALMASQTSVRGSHPQRLRLDEIDTMDIKILAAAQGQPMSGSTGIQTQTVMSSTLQYPNGTMAAILQRARERNWPVHEWCVDGNSVIMGVDKNYLAKNIRLGDKVYVYENGRIIQSTITNQWSSGIRKTIIIDTTEGSIICTPDHRILSSDGKWENAETYAKGDKVFCVRERACFSRPMGKKLKRNLQKLYKEKGTIKKQRINLPGLRGSKTNPVKNVLKMLSVKHDDKKYANSRSLGTGTSENSAIRKCENQSKQIRTGSRTIAGFITSKLSERTKHRQARCGFSYSGKENSDRSKREVLAYETRSDRKGQKKENRITKHGIQTAGTVVGRIPPLDVAIIKDVRDGGYREVFDLTVAQGESFIANNIVVHNCYKETSAAPDGWLTDREIARKRTEVPRVMWEVEYDLQEPSSEDRAIMPEQVKKMFDLKLGNFEGKTGEYIEIEPPRNEGVYVSGADWARKRDWTVIGVLRTDVEPVRLVAFIRIGRRPWPQMVAWLDKVNERYRIYGKSHNDGTGLGDVVNGYLQTQSEAVIMVGRGRSDMLSNCISAIENEEITAPFIKFLHDELLFASVDDVYGAGHLPDSLAMLSLAWMGVKRIDYTDWEDLGEVEDFESKWS